MTKIQNILRFAMRMEKDAGDFYTFYMEHVKSDPAKELFKELAAVEKYHYSILKSKFDELGFTEPPQTISWVVDENFKAIDPHILSDNSDTMGDNEKEMSDLTIMRMAFLIENDFALFYKNAANQVDDPASKEFLLKLEDWENQHREMFYEKYQELLRKYWKDLESIIFTD